MVNRKKIRVTLCDLSRALKSLEITSKEEVKKTDSLKQICVCLNPNPNRKKNISLIRSRIQRNPQLILGITCDPDNDETVNEPNDFELYVNNKDCNDFDDDDSETVKEDKLLLEDNSLDSNLYTATTPSSSVCPTAVRTTYGNNDAAVKQQLSTRPVHHAAESVEIHDDEDEDDDAEEEEDDEDDNEEDEEEEETVTSRQQTIDLTGDSALDLEEDNDSDTSESSDEERVDVSVSSAAQRMGIKRKLSQPEVNGRNLHPATSSSSATVAKLRRDTDAPDVYLAATKKLCSSLSQLATALHASSAAISALAESNVKVARMRRRAAAHVKFHRRRKPPQNN